MDYIRAVRVGIGYDVHRLVKGRPLVLGGVEIPYSLGLLGHSDADCLTHAICDALLGAGGRDPVHCPGCRIGVGLDAQDRHGQRAIL